MAWQLLVTRKDAPLRFYLGEKGITNIGDRCNIINSPLLKGVRNDMWLADESGALHIDIDQLRGIIGTLIRISKENPKFFLDLANHYRRVCLEFLATAESISSDEGIRSMPNEKLLEVLRKFYEKYYEFSPMLNIPFAVERGPYQETYKTLYLTLSKRIVEQLMTSSDGLLRFLFENLVDSKEIEVLVQRNLKKIIEFSEEPTFAERKDMQMLEIAGHVYKDKRLISALLDEKASRDHLLSVNKDLVDMIDKCLEEFRWIKQWGYPPYSLPATFEDYIKELREMVKFDPVAKLKDIRHEKKISKKRFGDFRNYVKMTEDELTVVNTINLYNFLRTWRMEIMMKSQYLSVPFFKEIEGRGVSAGKMKEDDIFFLTIPEIERFLIDSTVPSDIRERRKDWALVPKNGDFIMLSGKDLQEFRETFYSTLNHRENAHGQYTHDARSVGGKASNLYTLIGSEFKVPEFFVLTSKAYDLFIQKNSLEREIKNIFEEYKLSKLERKNLFDNIGKIEDAEGRLKALFMRARVPDTVMKSIENSISELGLTHFAVRSSATIDDSQTLSWAGRFKSFVYVSKDDVIDKVKDVWASLFCKEALIYGIENNINLLNNSMCIIVQKMIDPEISGVVNTVYDFQEPDFMEIEAIYGQCSPVVSGEITPDRYVIQKRDAKIIRKDTCTQLRLFGKQGWADVEGKTQKMQKLTDDKIAELAGICIKVESTFEKPQDIEWAMVGGEVYIVQSRPQTGISKLIVTSEETIAKKGELILTGLKGKVETILRGKALVLNSIKEVDKVKGGEILIVPFATPAWDPILAKVAAVVTNEGGATCHTIRVANEKKFPAVVGTEKATKVINDNDAIVIDTASDMFKGKVYREGKGNA